MKNILIIAIALLGGCAHALGPCEKVADMDDTIADQIEALEKAGVVDICRTPCEPPGHAGEPTKETELRQAYEVCKSVREAACSLVQATIQAQASFDPIYQICYK